MREQPPTPDEAAFYASVLASVPAAHDWYHADDDGTLWMTVSYDVVADGGVTETWRVDFDGRELVAGRSPAGLNWDDGVRGRETGMSLAAPHGFVAAVDSVEQAAGVTVAWFDEVTNGRALQ
jgi:hypothetical protein